MATRVELASGLAGNAVAVTPSDTTKLNFSGLYVGTGGDLIVKGSDPNQAAVTFKNAPSGFILPMVVSRVMAASTAADIVGFVPYLD